MGVDTKIYLPPYVAVNDIAKTTAVLAGGKVSLKEIGDNRRSVKVVEVEGLEIQTLPSMHSMLTIKFKDVLGGNRHCFLHYDGIENGSKLLSTRSTPFWIALGHRLINLFGGEMIYEDSSGNHADESVPINKSIWGKWWKMNNRRSLSGDETDAIFQRIQNVTHGLHPLRPQELIMAKPLAAYTSDQNFIVAFAKIQEDRLRGEIKATPVRKKKKV